MSDDQDPQEQPGDAPDGATEALAEDLEPSDEQAEQVTGGHADHRRRRRPRPHH